MVMEPPEEAMGRKRDTHYNVNSVFLFVPRTLLFSTSNSLCFVLYKLHLVKRAGNEPVQFKMEVLQ